MEMVPHNVLAQIFELAVLDDSERCRVCRRVQYFVFEQRTAKAIKGACRRWRNVFNQLVVLRLRPANVPIFCLLPQRCIWEYFEEVRDRQRSMRLRYYARSAYGRDFEFIAEPLEARSEEEHSSESDAEPSAESP